MQHVLRPFLTGGLALAAAVITVTPATPQLPAVTHQAVALTSLAAPAADTTSLGLITIHDGTVGLFPLGPMADLVGIGHMTLTEIVDFLGLGDEQVGTLAGGLVDGLGLGNQTLDDLVTGLGLATTKLSAVGGLLTSLGEAVPGLNDVTFGDVVGGLGLSDVNIAVLLEDLGGTNGALNGLLKLLGDITTVGSLVNIAGLTDASVFTGLGTLLTDPDAGIGNVDVISALDTLGLGKATLDQLLGALPLTMSTDSLLGDLGVGDATVDELLKGLDLYDHALFTLGDSVGSSAAELASIF